MLIIYGHIVSSSFGTLCQTDKPVTVVVEIVTDSLLCLPDVCRIFKAMVLDRDRSGQICYVESWKYLEDLFRIRRDVYISSGFSC